MQFYPQYRLEDFYGKHQYQGGLTLNQVEVLYEQAMIRKTEEFKFHAAIHGASFDEDKNKSDGTQQSSQRSASELKQPSNQSLPIFQDPKEYERMDDAQKEQLTQKMMKQHKQWAKKAL